MSINFSPAIILWTPDEVKALDVYFQPAWTWTHNGNDSDDSNGTQGVALLFLEHHPASSDIEKQDFRELVKGLVRWIWAAAGKNETEPVTLATAQDVYDEFTQTSLRYDDLKAFLNAHYQFQIQECRGDMHGTVFPMFPSLELKVGTGDPESFSAASKALGPDQIDVLRAASAALQVQFEAGIQAPTIEANSVAAFLFTGYARLLMRTGLQAVIDDLEARLTSDAILNGLNTIDDTVYGNIARMASRFLLHGLSLPVDVFGSGDTQAAAPITNEGLYVCTGQQYDFSRSRIASEGAYRVTLRMGEVVEAAIQLPETDAEGRSQLVYSIPVAPEENDPKLLFLALAQALDDLPKNTELLQSAQPTAIPFYGEELLHFALRGRVAWEKDPSSKAYILPLSTTLLDYLEQRRNNPNVDLIVWTKGDPGQAQDIPNDDFNWGTRIDVTMLRVPKPEGDGFLQEIYEVGGSREADKDRLEAILVFLNSQPNRDAVEIDMLYGPAGVTNPVVKNIPGLQDQSLLLKANLSTDTPAAPSTEFSAKLANQEAFLKLLWEALDVDTGGFYLHLPHGDADLDATLFGGRDRAVLTFLIQLTDPSDPIHDFNTCAVFTAEIDVETDLVLARSDESIPVLSMPPGFLGFQIDKRSRVPATENDALRELNVLYQLLGWRVVAHTKFKESQPGLPIGPTVLEADASKWLYERLVPVSALLETPPPPGPTDLPASAKDPYLGVGTASGADPSELKVETWWQDIYGNAFLASQTSQTFPVRYTDPLIGINQWPSVAENYTFVPENGVARLNLSFSFDPSPYAFATHAAAQDPAASRANRIQSDKAAIEKVYYQILQEDVTFTLSTSIDETWPAPSVDKEQILNFVCAIYRYLENVEANPLLTAPEPYTQRIDGSAIQVRQNFIFQVTVTMQMSRELDLILDELKLDGDIKKEYENVLQAPATLSPKYESNTIAATAGQSLAELATAASQDSSSVISAVDLLGANPSHPSLLVAGVRVVPSNLTPDVNLFNIDSKDWAAYVAQTSEAITIQAGETPQLLARRFRLDMTEKLDRPVNFVIADLAAVLANDTSVLSGGSELRVGGLNLLSFAEHFQAAFPGLHLAVSEDRNVRNRASSTRLPLYAVRLGPEGITYDIQEQRPVYFAIPPLANSLLAASVPIDDYASWKAAIPKGADLDDLRYDPESEDAQFEAIDLNVLARHFLVALETFLDPATLVPAYQLSSAKVDSILRQKAILAGILSNSVLPVLEKDAVSDAAEAKEAMRQELLVDLVKGYDIETIVQFAVQVTVGSALTGVLDWPLGLEPRVRGRANVLGVKVGENPASRVSVALDQLDYTLSAGKISLRNKSELSTFTYLFDTKTPELFANLELELEFVPTDIEFDIENLSGITDRQASNFLSFIRPDPLRQTMGASPVPIPLRHYPMPPSLIFQRAEADPTSLTVLADVRQWKYSIVYEHPDVSQDSIDCILQLNVPEIDNLPTTSGRISPPTDLFRSLVNFGEVYPQLAVDLKILQRENLVADPASQDDRNGAKKAIVALESLVRRVVEDWQTSVTDVTIYSPTAGDLHFEISEERGANEGERQALVTALKTVDSKIGGPAIEPTLALPGSKEKVAPVRNGQTIIFTFEPDPGDLTFFGDSSVPDRKLIVENLDVIEHQNAWASVWLSRNKQLIREADGPVNTNLAFVFQTPAVRFNTMVNPFITNDEPWDIATLNTSDNTPRRRTLEAHLSSLIQVLFPSFPGSQYEVRLSCRYAFSLATGQGLNEDLVTTLPILLGLRITPDALAAAYVTDLRNEIRIWLAGNRPSTDRASLIFNIDLFSKLDADSNSSLPMLRITHLGLALKQISDLDELLRPLPTTQKE